MKCEKRIDHDWIYDIRCRKCVRCGDYEIKQLEADSRDEKYKGVGFKDVTDSSPAATKSHSLPIDQWDELEDARRLAWIISSPIHNLQWFPDLNILNVYEWKQENNWDNLFVRTKWDGEGIPVWSGESIAKIDELRVKLKSNLKK